MSVFIQYIQASAEFNFHACVTQVFLKFLPGIVMITKQNLQKEWLSLLLLLLLWIHRIISCTAYYKHARWPQICNNNNPFKTNFKNLFKSCHIVFMKWWAWDLMREPSLNSHMLKYFHLYHYPNSNFIFHHELKQVLPYPTHYLWI